jgi:aarF domain-containing kinase
LAASVSIGITSFMWWDDRYNDRTVTRNLRTAYHGIMIAVDYKMNFDPNSLQSIEALHERAAARLLTVCEKNR